MGIQLDVELTNEARKKYVDMLVNGRSFLIEQFVTGEGGHDPSNPTLSLTPPVEALSLPGLTFGPKDVDSIIDSNVFSVQVNATLESAEGVGPLSNIGLIARVNYSVTPSDPLLNTTFLFAIGNMPLQNKLDGETKEFELFVNF